MTREDCLEAVHMKDSIDELKSLNSSEKWKENVDDSTNSGTW
jgi:hypothetical protein